MCYIKNINEADSLNLEQLQEEYNFKGRDLYCYIGNNGKIYIVFANYTLRPVFAENRVLCLTVGWNSSREIISKNILDFSENFEDIFVIQPMGNNYLIRGKYKKNDNNIGRYGGKDAKYRVIKDKTDKIMTRFVIKKDGSENYAVHGDGFHWEDIEIQYGKDETEDHKYYFITDNTGSVLRKIFVGLPSAKTCIADSQNRIAAGYYDQGIFEDARMKPGLIVYDDFGNILWENTKYDIVNCYGLDIDDDGDIWFLPDNKLVKIDSQNNYNIYTVSNKFMRGFLYNKKQNRFIFERGYPDLNKFIVKDFINYRFANEQFCDFKCGGKSIDVEGYTFRNSKALIWDKNILYWFDWSGG